MRVNSYSSKRWRTLRLRILARDYSRCWVAGCPRLATVVDHIEPAYPGMSSARFHDPSNLRASCQRHNTARGVAARLQREMEDGADPDEVVSLGARGGR